MTWRAALVLAAAAVVGAAGGCNADLGTVRFQMPTKVYRFTTTRAIWASAPATMPAAACTAAADCCKPLGEVTIDCSVVGLQCDQSLCGMTVALDRWQPIWILREVPDLALLDRGALLGLEVTRVRVRPAEDPRPDAPPAAVTLLFGPYDAQLGTDMRSRAIAEAPEVRLGGEGSTDAVLTPHARTALRALLEKPYEPLSMVAVARLPLPPHAAIPKGEFAVALDIELATKLGL